MIKNLQDVVGEEILNCHIDKIQSNLFQELFKAQTQISSELLIKHFKNSILEKKQDYKNMNTKYTGVQEPLILLMAELRDCLLLCPNLIDAKFFSYNFELLLTVAVPDFINEIASVMPKYA